MKARFLKSTNSYLYEKYKGLLGDLWISRGMAFISKDQRDEHSFRTSLIDTISNIELLMLLIKKSKPACFD